MWRKLNCGGRDKFSLAYPCGDPCVGLRVYPVSSGACALNIRVGLCVALRGFAFIWKPAFRALLLWFVCFSYSVSVISNEFF